MVTLISDVSRIDDCAKLHEFSAVLTWLCVFKWQSFCWECLKSHFRRTVLNNFYFCSFSLHKFWFSLVFSFFCNLKILVLVKRMVIIFVLVLVTNIALELCDACHICWPASLLLGIYRPLCPVCSVWLRVFSVTFSLIIRKKQCITMCWFLLVVCQMIADNPLLAGNPELQQQMVQMLPTMLERVC